VRSVRYWDSTFHFRTGAVAVVFQSRSRGTPCHTDKLSGWVEPAQRALLDHRSKQDRHAPILLRVSLSVPVTALQFFQRLRVLLGIVTPRLHLQRIACFQRP